MNESHPISFEREPVPPGIVPHKSLLTKEIGTDLFVADIEPSGDLGSPRMQNNADIRKQIEELTALYSEYINKTNAKNERRLDIKEKYKDMMGDTDIKGGSPDKEKLIQLIQLIREQTPGVPEEGSKLFTYRGMDSVVSLGKVGMIIEELGENHAMFGSQTNWISDNEKDKCMICQQLFGNFIRRHHCRACGMLVCNNCSHNKLPLKSIQTEGCEIKLNEIQKKVRVCLGCFEECEKNTYCVDQNGDDSIYCNMNKQGGGYRKSKRISRKSRRSLIKKTRKSKKSKKKSNSPKTYKKRSYRKSKESKRKTRRSFLKKTKKTKNKRMIGGGDPTDESDDLTDESGDVDLWSEAPDSETVARAARERGEISSLNFSIKTIKKLLEQHKFPIGGCNNDECLREIMKDFLTKFPTNTELKNLVDLHKIMGYIKANKYYKMAETQNPGKGKEELQTAAIKLYYVDENKIDHLINLLGHELSDINSREMALAHIENAKGDIPLAYNKLK